MIKVGDLVMVVRYTGTTCGCKGPGTADSSSLKLGHIFTVGKIWGAHLCSAGKHRIERLAAQPDDGRWVCASFSDLKRIDPLPESEDIKEREELSA